MAEVALDRPRVVVIVGEFVAARVAKHVAMDEEGEARRCARSSHHPLVTGDAQWRSAFGHEDVDARLTFPL